METQREKRHLYSANVVTRQTWKEQYSRGKTKDRNQKKERLSLPSDCHAVTVDMVPPYMV